MHFMSNKDYPDNQQKTTELNRLCSSLTQMSSSKMAARGELMCPDDDVSVELF